MKDNNHPKKLDLIPKHRRAIPFPKSGSAKALEENLFFGEYGADSFCRFHLFLNAVFNLRATFQGVILHFNQLAPEQASKTIYL